MLEAVVAEQPGRPVRRGRGPPLRPPRQRARRAEETALARLRLLSRRHERPAHRDCSRWADAAVGKLDAETHAFLAQVANQAHIVMENSRLFERVRNLAIRDSLTELYNHRHAMDLLTNEFERVGRYAEGVSVLMVDVDHFKRINDEHGHPAGDAVLKEMARLLQGHPAHRGLPGPLRGRGVRGHPAPHLAGGGAATAERIRRKVASHVFRVGRRSPQRHASAWAWPATRRPASTRRKPGARGGPRPLPRQGGGTEPGGMTDDRARTPATCPWPRWRRFSPRPPSRRRLRRPLLRAPAHLVAAARGGDHPHRLRGRDLRPRACGWCRGERTGYAYTDDLSGAAMARAAETAAHIAPDTRTLPPQPVSPAPVDRRYGADDLACWTWPTASRSSSARTARRGPTTRASRRSSRPWATRPSRCASRTPRACWPRTSSRSSPSACP